MFQDQVFGFTPKGELIALPRGATPSTSPMPSTPRSATPASAPRSTAACAAAHPAANGDQVEIITSKAQTPSPTWERFVVTGKARAASAASSARSSAPNISISAARSQKAFRQEGHEFTERPLEGVLRPTSTARTDDLYVASARVCTGRARC